MRDMLKPSLSLFVICMLTAFCLAFVNAITKDTIKLRSEKDAEEQRKLVLEKADSFKELEDWNSMDESGLIDRVFAAYSGQNLVGYVMEASPSGFGGEIAVTVGIGSDKKISGVRVGENSETPGLGTKTADDSFTGQFVGKDLGVDFKVVKKPASSDDEIQAISGATVSTNAVTRAVAACARLGGKLLEEGYGGDGK
ncbi:MAG: RnfABCDGE type electron transport complex subunit G [Bacillota bacterium]